MKTKFKVGDYVKCPCGMLSCKYRGKIKEIKGKDCSLETQWGLIVTHWRGLVPANDLLIKELMGVK